MCIDCLNNQLDEIEEYEQALTEFLDGITCECCKSYPSFLKDCCRNLKILCLTKKKKHTETMDYQGWRKLLTLEEAFKMRLDAQLQSAMEQMDEQKEGLTSENYLVKANQLKSLKDIVKQLDDAEHR
jgi:hypothetical protein